MKGKKTSGPSILAASSPGAVISNGTVSLGLYGESHLTFNNVGLAFGGNDSLTPGCYCEGWGVADTISGVTGYANESTDGGVQNMTMVSFGSTASTANSVVRIGSTFQVTHNWHPSATPNLYEATVGITNISGAPVDAVYRRVMDWDIAPSYFYEYVTIQGTTDVIKSNNNGFNTANPLVDYGSLGATGQFTDYGPTDQGAMIDFRIGTLAPGQSKQFRIYYGAANTEANALSALTTVGAQVYSLGQPNGGQTTGAPNTYIFGYARSCQPGLAFASPLSTTSAYTMPRAATIDIRFTYAGSNNCALDDSVTLVVRDAANARTRYVAHVLHRDLEYDPMTMEYHVLFSPATYGVPANTTARADVYFGGTRVGYALINVTP
ncbi:MAG TPA: hypothetical protein VK191_12565 [Symbiobacteriaceae bacterium]|nr:hypothetical protein [Symbiobacteriaceae bacterium]